MSENLASISKRAIFGFTLLELVIVMAIGLALISLVFNSLSSLRQSEDLKNSANFIGVTLEEARGLTLSSKNNSVYGVHLASSTAVLFRGLSYSASDPENKPLFLSSLVVIASSTIAGGAVDIVFQRVSGKTDQYGSIGVSLAADPTRYKTITVHQSGLVEVGD